jgi:hypothetical protein
MSAGANKTSVAFFQSRLNELHVIPGMQQEAAAAIDAAFDAALNKT